MDMNDNTENSKDNLEDIRSKRLDSLFNCSEFKMTKGTNNNASLRKSKKLKMFSEKRKLDLQGLDTPLSDEKIASLTEDLSGKFKEKMSSSAIQDQIDSLLPPKHFSSYSELIDYIRTKDFKKLAKNDKEKETNLSGLILVQIARYLEIQDKDIPDIFKALSGDPPLLEKSICYLALSKCCQELSESGVKSLSLIKEYNPISLFLHEIKLMKDIENVDICLVLIMKLIVVTEQNDLQDILDESFVGTFMEIFCNKDTPAEVFCKICYILSSLMSTIPFAIIQAFKNYEVGLAIKYQFENLKLVRHKSTLITFCNFILRIGYEIESMLPELYFTIFMIVNKVIYEYKEPKFDEEIGLIYLGLQGLDLFRRTDTYALIYQEAFGPKFIESSIILLHSPDQLIQEFTLRLICEFIERCREKAPEYTDRDLFQYVQPLLDSDNKKVQVTAFEVLISLSYSRHEDCVDYCHEKGIYSLGFKYLNNEDVNVKEEALWLIKAAIDLVCIDQEDIQLLSEAIDVVSIEAKLLILSILKICLSKDLYQKFPSMIEECGLLDKIETLQTHENMTISKLAIKIVDTWFSDSTDFLKQAERLVKDEVEEVPLNF
ncbi:unnamed protein product [Moneuplotes crassus]|uniref:Uncharacterized protein n=1 Tax=Euplotes crassus TaxID=5936 RepID=A0AAD1X799_EUPCR|nr:unnamed protein product [Moneuplotes crassus]